MQIITPKTESTSDLQVFQQSTFIGSAHLEDLLIVTDDPFTFNNLLSYILSYFYLFLKIFHSNKLMIENYTSRITNAFLIK